MQPFLLHCLSLQALRRGAGRRRKGLVFRKMLHFGKIPKNFGQNLARFSKNSAKSWQNLLNFILNQQKIQQFLTKQLRLEKVQRCKGLHCVDLGASFPTITSIYLQNLASIKPRTSLVKFARSPRTDPPGCDEG